MSSGWRINLGTVEQNSSFTEKQARQLLGSLPERWGRMDIMSRSALVGVGQAMHDAGLLAENNPVLLPDWTGGIIVGSRRGSLVSDLEYAGTVKEGAGMASPHLFSYTLPNIALAEAAIQYRLTGPAFVLMSEQPYEEAVLEAQQWLAELPGENVFMVAGALDVIPGRNEHAVTTKFTLIQN